jgi:hypothetical protein
LGKGKFSTVYKVIGPDGDHVRLFIFPSSSTEKGVIDEIGDDLRMRCGYGRIEREGQEDTYRTRANE